MRVSKYDIVCENEMGELKERVNGMIKEGWQPVGGVIIIQANSLDELLTYYYQTMILVE